jgi:hypothetical protein
MKQKLKTPKRPKAAPQHKFSFPRPAAVVAGAALSGNSEVATVPKVEAAATRLGLAMLPH